MNTAIYGSTAVKKLETRLLEKPLLTVSSRPPSPQTMSPIRDTTAIVIEAFPHNLRRRLLAINGRNLKNCQILGCLEIRLETLQRLYVSPATSSSLSIS